MTSTLALQAYRLSWAALGLAGFSLAACVYLNTGKLPNQLALVDLTHGLGGMAAGMAWATVSWLWFAR